eukprot:gene11451-34161_t
MGNGIMIPSHDSLELIDSQFLIEVLQGEDIVARKRGFTVNTCVASLPVESEGDMVGLPVGEKVRRAGNAKCRKSEGDELKSTCATSCQLACQASMETTIQAGAKFSGITVDETTQRRMVKSCSRQCTSGCFTSGKVTAFDVPSRR